MPDPKYLLELKKRAEKALNAEPPDGLTAFTASWMLLEAVRRRMLVLACRQEGWTVHQARRALMDERIDNAQFLSLFRNITGTHWTASLPIAARKLWPGILRSVELRRRIIHGTTRTGEENLQRSAWLVLRFVNRLRDHPLGDPMKKLSPGSKQVRTDQSLAERLGTPFPQPE